MTATVTPWDAVRPWCACCLEHRVEYPGDYLCCVCEPKPPKAFPPLPPPRQPWTDAERIAEFARTWGGAA